MSIRLVDQYGLPFTQIVDSFEIDGIIGMDLLQRLKANINVEEMILTCK